MQSEPISQIFRLLQIPLTPLKLKTYLIIISQKFLTPNYPEDVSVRMHMWIVFRSPHEMRALKSFRHSKIKLTFHSLLHYLVSVLPPSTTVF